MSYKGTVTGYHLFKIYTKCTTNDALVYDIAIPAPQCEVAYPRTCQRRDRDRKCDLQKAGAARRAMQG